MKIKWLFEMGLHEYIRMNMEPISRIQYVWAFVCACNVQTYIHWSQLKTDLISGKIYVYFTILAGLALQRSIHTLNRSPSRRIKFLWFSKQTESSCKIPSLNHNAVQNSSQRFFYLKKTVDISK